MSAPSLIETMRLAPGEGILRFNLHSKRLTNSACIFGYEGARQALASLHPFQAGALESLRLRLELFADGHHELTTAPFQPLPDETVWRLRIAKGVRLASTDPKLRHKTSLRDHYNQARAEYSAEVADEVLLLNEKGELCEGTITNLFVEDDRGTLMTPPLSSGCLAGVLRTSLICSGKAKMRRLLVDDIKGRPLYVGNSLRGLIPARLEME